MILLTRYSSSEAVCISEYRKTLLIDVSWETGVMEEFQEEEEGFWKGYLKGIVTVNI